MYSKKASDSVNHLHPHNRHITLLIDIGKDNSCWVLNPNRRHLLPLNNCTYLIVYMVCLQVFNASTCIIPKPFPIFTVLLSGMRGAIAAIGYFLFFLSNSMLECNNKCNLQFHKTIINSN